MRRSLEGAQTVAAELPGHGNARSFTFVQDGLVRRAG